MTDFKHKRSRTFITLRARVTARGAIRAFGAALIGLVWGCAATDATKDYERATTVVRERMGIEVMYAPPIDAMIDERVQGCLADGLSVDEAVRVALLNNREFQALVAQIGASRADLAQSALLSNPTLSLGLQFPEGGGLADLSVGFAQQLADLWQLPVKRRLAEADLERAILEVGQRAVELASEVRVRCYQVLALEQATRYSEENERLIQRTVELSGARLRAGESSESDLVLARLGGFQVHEEVLDTRARLEQARADLAQILGLSLRAGEIQLTDAFPDASVALPADGVMFERALDDRFDLRVAYFLVQRAEASLQLETRRFLHDVQVGLAFERGERRSLPGRKILADTARASVAAGSLTAPTIQSRGERALEKSQIIDAKLGPTLALTLPIFDSNQAQIVKARVRVLQARKEYEAKVEAIAAEVQRTTCAVRSAAGMLQFQNLEALPQTEAAVEGAERRYREGEAGILVLLEAQDELVKRRSSHAGALRDYAVALARLTSAIGGGALPQDSVEPTSETSPEPAASQPADPG